MSLNLCGEKSKGVECYSPSKVVAARQYHEAKKAAEARAKLEKKIQRAANALKNKQLKEVRAAKQAAKQLAEDLQSANSAVKKAPSKTKPVAVKAKKTIAKVPKATKARAISNPPAKSMKKGVNEACR